MNSAWAFEVLKPWEILDLKRETDGLEWHAAQKRAGVRFDALRRALEGRPVLRETARAIRRALYSAEGL